MFPSDRGLLRVVGGSKRVEHLSEAADRPLSGLGKRLEPVGELDDAFLASNAGHARIHVDIFVGLAGDCGLEDVAGRTDRLAGRRVAHFLEIFEMAVRVPGLALGSRAEHRGEIFGALNGGVAGETEITAGCPALAPKNRPPTLLPPGSPLHSSVP